MIRVYCDHITPRLRFIFDFIFGDILGSACHLTTDPEEFAAFDGPKFTYSATGFPGVLNLRPHTLLEEKEIREQQIKITMWNGLPVFFQVEGPSVLPFDPFAVSFYLITRYEEYLPFEPDEHGRFRPERSLAFKENFLRIPLVDAIARELKELLKADFPALDFPGQPFRFIPSFDIDIAYAHMGKGFARALGGWAKLILKADICQAKERLLTLLGKISDPYDNFSLHLDLAKKYGHPLLYFVLLGDFSRYDRNSSFKSRGFRKLLQELNEKAVLGIHPSYRSHLRDELFEEEKRRLGDITGRTVTNNRFHFLRLKFPESYRLLISQGINDDYSLGYSSLNGFRASTCTPFFFYDLEKEEKTGLKLHPFLFMDSAMIDHLKLSPAEAIQVIKSLAGQVAKYGGEAIGIWHNYSLSEKDQYKGWQEVLISILEYYKKEKA
jgi:hypothetical protein